VKRRLIVLARAPLPGQAKTRLAASIGEMEAAGVYARLLYAYLLELARGAWTGVTLQLSVASRVDLPFFARAFPEFDVRAQASGDLGTRLAASFEDAFAEGAESVVVTASDIHALDNALICAAFRALGRAPAVIGPCQDGGYYLLGMRAPGAPLFENVAWGTDRVLEQTEELARAAGLSVVRLSERMDIDVAEDLTRWHQAIGAASSTEPSTRES
jgi:hypothetical protein